MDFVCDSMSTGRRFRALAIVDDYLRECPALEVDSSIPEARVVDVLDRLAEKFGQARQLSSPNLPSVELYLALLAYRLTTEEGEELISRLRLPKSIAQTLRDTNSLKAKLQSLTDPELAPSRIYHLLHDYSPSAITANSLATDSLVARQHIHLFLTKLRYVKPSLTGNDLQKLGITPGPRMKEILQRLHEARLDGKVTDKKGEEELVRKLQDR